MLRRYGKLSSRGDRRRWMIKPNRDEIIAITIMVSAAIGFVLGVLSGQKEIADKDKDIEELIEIVETQEDLIDKLLK